MYCRFGIFHMTFIFVNFLFLNYSRVLEFVSKYSINYKSNLDIGVFNFSENFEFAMATNSQILAKIKFSQIFPNLQYYIWIFLYNTIIIIIISVLEPRFPLPRVGLFDKSSSKTSSPLRAILRVSRVHI